MIIDLHGSESARAKTSCGHGKALDCPLHSPGGAGAISPPFLMPPPLAGPLPYLLAACGLAEEGRVTNCVTTVLLTALLPRVSPTDTLPWLLLYV